MRIRDFKPEDSAALAAVFYEAVHRIGIRDYSQAQVDVWSPHVMPADRFLARVSDGRAVFVAVGTGDSPVAFIELERDGHIDFLYCHPDVAGSGVGKALFDRLEEAALADGLSRLYVEASEAARRFFLKEGFTLIRRRDFARYGVQIHNYLMEKQLG